MIIKAFGTILFFFLIFFFVLTVESFVCLFLEILISFLEHHLREMPTNSR